MKVILKITHSAARAIIDSMTQAGNDASFGAYFDAPTSTYYTCGRSTWRVSGNTLTFQGSRASFAAGALWGGIYKRGNDYRVYLTYGYTDYPCRLTSIETSWRVLFGADDPFTQTFELLDSYREVLQYEALEDQYITYEFQLMSY